MLSKKLDKELVAEKKRLQKEKKELEKVLKQKDRLIAKQDKILDLRKRKDKDLLKEVTRRGYFPVKKDVRQDETYKFPIRTKSIKIGVVSDTHLGSNKQQLTFLNQFYKECKKEGITMIVHAGDVMEGSGFMHRDQRYEMFLHGLKNQLDYAEKFYPKVKGITTYMIAGNHDASWWNSEGYDFVEELARRRDDIIYLGMYGAFLKIGKTSVYVMHPDGGNAYARSYKMQKIIEQLPPESKPHILLVGHYHTTCHMPRYRNVEGIQLGCFQAQTQYLKRKALNPDISALVLTINQNTAGLESIETKWRHWYVPIVDDF